MKAEEYEQFKGKKASYRKENGVICGYDPIQPMVSRGNYRMCLLMHRPSVKQEFTSAYKFVIDKEYQGYDCFWVSPNYIINEP